jgi:hypothetical protein
MTYGRVTSDAVGRSKQLEITVKKKLFWANKGIPSLYHQLNNDDLIGRP